jgi:PAS domain-containing protein
MSKGIGLMPARAPRRALYALVGSEAQAAVAFCGHCGARPRARLAFGAPSRVCAECELGLILRAAPEAAPGAREAFLVVGASMEICAVSDRAERMLGVGETEAVNHRLDELLAPDDGRPADYSRLVDAIPRLVAGAAPIDAILVRSTQTPEEPLRVRLGTCEPPPAALLVLRDRG